MIYQSREHVEQNFQQFCGSKVPDGFRGTKFFHFWASMRCLPVTGRLMGPMAMAVAICLVPWLVEALPKAHCWFLWRSRRWLLVFWLQKEALTVWWEYIMDIWIKIGWCYVMDSVFEVLIWEHTNPVVEAQDATVTILQANSGLTRLEQEELAFMKSPSMAVMVLSWLGGNHLFGLMFFIVRCFEPA